MSDWSGTMLTSAQLNQLNRSEPVPRWQLTEPGRDFNAVSECRCRKMTFSWKILALVLLLTCAFLAAFLTYFAVATNTCQPLPPEDVSCVMVDHEEKRQFDNTAVTTTHHPNPPFAQTEPQQIANRAAPTLAVHPPIHSTLREDPPNKLYENSYLEEIYPNQDPINIQVRPFSFWIGSVYIPSYSVLKLNLLVPRASPLALYGRRNVPPTVTQYDFSEFLRFMNSASIPDDERRHGKAQRFAKRYKRSSEERSTFVSFLNVTSSPVTLARVNRAANYKATRDARKYSAGPQSEPEIPDTPKFTKRLQTQLNLTVTQLVEGGKWYIGVYNDDVIVHDITLHAQTMEDEQTTCINACSGHGTCSAGKCFCEDGYTGKDCSVNICPVLCSGRGYFLRGKCKCDEGWSGVECEISTAECPAEGCGEHGICSQGHCLCESGYSGTNCQDRDCDLLGCPAKSCAVDCGTHGTWNETTGSCSCQLGWDGEFCTKQTCNLNCGLKGVCQDGKCVCQSGWEGPYCDVRTCDHRCFMHGQCKNGTCVCARGWNGKHCTLEGCPMECSGHGECTSRSGPGNDYYCHCREGWSGNDCSIPLEMNCDDDIDNDGDGLVDCADTECCSRPECAGNLMCLASPEPIDILLRKQPPPVSASFYQRAKFLIEENAVQSYAHRDEYSESEFWTAFNVRRATIVRGRVVNGQGTGITGVRVSIENQPRLGFTLSRNGGWYDLLINGGGAVNIQFQRSPFHTETRTVMTPWNKIVVIDDVMMRVYDERKSDEPIKDKLVQECSPQLYGNFTLEPTIITTWNPNLDIDNPIESDIFFDGQLVRNSVNISDTNLKLVHRSTSTSGYRSILLMTLTPDSIPDSLKYIHIQVTVEGSVFKKTFEADSNILHVFSWDRKNVYKQKVYGLTEAVVAVGYEYHDCDSVIWHHSTVTLKGYDVDISNIGGWNLDVHHHYNHNEGILQKGDGSSIYFSDYPRLLKTVAGVGLQRTMECSECSRPTEPLKAQFQALSTLATGPDGSIYIADFNYIRKLTSDGKLITVVKLGTSLISYQYHLAVSPFDNSIFISDPEKRQVLQVVFPLIDGHPSMVDLTQPAMSSQRSDRGYWLVYAGNGQICTIDDDKQCGDGGLAKEAQLSYPKGIVMDDERSLYIADGRTIRKVDSRGIIQTVVGVEDFPDLSAFGSSCADPSNLVHWPTKLAVNPLDNLLYWSERSSIYKLAKEKIHLVAGLPDFCTAPATRKAPIRIGNVIDFTITPSGRIIIAAQRGEKTLFEVSTRGEITSIKCASDTYQYIYESNITTIQPTLALTDSADCNQHVTSIAVAPDNSLYIGDSKRLKLYQLISPIPNPDSNGEYTIQWPKTGEVFVFNRYGHHIGTKCLLTDRVRYVFVYNKNTSLGKLTMVTDATGGRVTVVREYTDAATGIETHGGTKMHVTVARHGLLSAINETRYGSHYAFDYDGVTGFIVGREEPTGDIFFFTYDDLGRLSKFVAPTGETYNLNYKLNGVNHEVALARGAEIVSSVEVNGNSWKNRRQNLASWMYADGSQYLTMGGTKEYFEGELQAVLTNPLRFKGNFSEWRKVSIYKVRLGDEFIQQSRAWKMKRTIDWKGKAILEASYLTNNATFMAVEAELPSGRITILDRDRIPLLVSEPQDGGIRYWNLPWNPSQRKASDFSSVDTGQEVSLQKTINGISYSVVVNRHGKISMMTLPSGRNFRYIYQENSGLRGIIFPSGTTHDFSIEASFDYYKFIHHHSGTSKQLVHHFSLEGNLLLTLLPGDLGRTVYRYNNYEHLREIVSGYDRYIITHGPVTTVRHIGRDIEYKCDFVCVTEGVCTEIKFEFGGKSGLANARFLLKYDQNLRVVGIKGRVGGQALPEQNSKYSEKTNSLSQINDFKFSKLSLNETSIYDGTAAFQKHIDSNLRIWKTTLTINDAELFRAEYIYDRSGRINQTRTFIRYVGLKSFINVKNYTYDPDGQLIAVDSPESWNFQYDTRGNLALLNYRGNAIPVQHDQQDRMTRLGEGFYAYDDGGRVLQNAREEKYQWSSSGLLVKAAKKGLLEVKYTYDHYKRLIARRDHHGNLTQFFYTDLERPHLVTHMYSSRDARLVSYTYDDRGHLIFIQYQRYKFYVATDLCGTPLVLFNQYGEIVREMVRSPYGHVVYDSNPYIYIGIDWCGSLIDPATGLVHSAEGQVYDPLLGQYLAPNYDVFLKHVYDPIRLHFYRINGNDPINFRKEVKLPAKTEDVPEVLSLLGYNIATAQNRRSVFDMTYSGLNIFARFTPSIRSGINSMLTPARKEDFLTFIEPSQIVKPHDIFEFKFARQSSSLGKGLVATSETKNMRLYSAANTDIINRDVYTSILSQSAKLPVNSYHGHQDIFYFFKEGVWRASDDVAQLNRLGSRVNLTVHDFELDGEQCREIKVNTGRGIISLHYGSDSQKELERIQKHLIRATGRKAWLLEREYAHRGYLTNQMWTATEAEQLIQDGHVTNYRAELVHPIHLYPELANDPMNIRFKRKS